MGSVRLAPYTLETGLVLEILREDSSFFCSKPSEDRGRQISVDIIFPSFLALWDPRFMQELAFSVWLGPKNYLLFPELYSLLKPDWVTRDRQISFGANIGSKTSVDSRFPDASELWHFPYFLSSKLCL